MSRGFTTRLQIGVLLGRNRSSRLVGLESHCFARQVLQHYQPVPANTIKLIEGYSYRSINSLMSAELMEFDAKGKISRVLAHYAVPERDPKLEPFAPSQLVKSSVLR